MARGGGLITAEDLAGYKAVLRTPVEGTYRGLRVVSMPPPSSGGIALLELLGMMETMEPRGWGFHSVAHIHMMCEIEKRVFADRSEYLGDPDFYRVPTRALLEPAYLKARAEGLPKDHRTPPDQIAAGEIREKNETTHFSIVDAKGNAVANTTTLNDSYGSGIVVRGAGFLLNNEMDDFSSKPGVPNLFGVIGGEANAIAPRKRMLSSMTPTFVFREGKLWLVLGSPGGPTIFTTVFQVLVNRVDFGMTLEDAVARPRVHHQWPPPKKGTDPILVERDFDPSVAEGLRKLGYEFIPRPRLGDVEAIEIDGSLPSAACDHRGIGRSASD
jgi:gamma-glutamyltranspeptidase/glutathione hydrolase